MDPVTTLRPSICHPELDEVEQVSRLVKNCFERFVASDFEPSGIELFTDFTSPESLIRRSFSGHSLLVAKADSQITGMIELSGWSHVSLLFVDPAFHNQGIARRLWDTAREICLKHDPSLTSISANSSRYAQPIYERLGFHAAGEYQVVDGIRFIRMEYRIADISPTLPRI